jgi:iron complex transport system substrate-binding protein
MPYSKNSAPLHIIMEALTEDLQDRVDIIKHKLKFIEQKPVVACIVSLDPLTLAGADLSESIGIAGGTLITGEAEALLSQNPDIVILIPQGFTIEQTMKHIDQVLQLPGFAELKAVRNNRFYIADGIRSLNESPECFVDGVELFAEIINPKQFIFGYEGEGWIKFSL